MTDDVTWPWEVKVVTLENSYGDGSPQSMCSVHEPFFVIVGNPASEGVCATAQVWNVNVLTTARSRNRIWVIWRTVSLQLDKHLSCVLQASEKQQICYDMTCYDSRLAVIFVQKYGNTIG